MDMITNYPINVIKFDPKSKSFIISVPESHDNHSMCIMPNIAHVKYKGGEFKVSSPHFHNEKNEVVFGIPLGHINVEEFYGNERKFENAMNQLILTHFRYFYKHIPLSFAAVQLWLPNLKGVTMDILEASSIPDTTDFETYMGYNLYVALPETAFTWNGEQKHNWMGSIYSARREFNY